MFRLEERVFLRKTMADAAEGERKRKKEIAADHKSSKIPSVLIVVDSPHCAW
jgi:hypothetical protein